VGTLDVARAEAARYGRANRANRRDAQCRAQAKDFAQHTPLREADRHRRQADPLLRRDNAALGIPGHLLLDQSQPVHHQNTEPELCQQCCTCEERNRRVLRTAG
jgi:hypothetical protein